MFWKFLVSVLILPSCLGFEIAAASIKNGVQTLPSEELGLSPQQTKANRDVVNSSLFPIKGSSSIQGDREADTEELRHTNYQHPYLLAHRYYQNSCLQGHRYYLRGYYYPESAGYNRQYYHNNRYYRHRNYYPQYYRYGDYHNNSYYRHGYYNQRYYYNNGYYRHGDYYPGYYHQRY